MPNALNQKMLTEIEGFLKASEDCVVVDFTGMAVADAERMRTQLRGSDMQMRVLKTSLARIAARNLSFKGADELFTGSSAIVYGGESVAEVARSVKEYAKGKKAPKVRGGLLEKRAIGPNEVELLASLPPRKELLGQVLATLIAPMTGLLGAATSLLSAVPSLTRALVEKMDENSKEGP
ncbi:MAG: 50S ribosomal protein L10 [Planctomycetota bacterium]